MAGWLRSWANLACADCARAQSKLKVDRGVGTCTHVSAARTVALISQAQGERGYLYSQHQFCTAPDCLRVRMYVEEATHTLPR